MRHRVLFVSHYNWTFARRVVAALAARPDLETRTLELNNLHDDRIGPPRNNGRASAAEEERLARDAMGWADTIFVEFCSANAAWFSRHLPGGKRLVIRLHSSELNVRWPAGVAWERVSAVIFVADHVRDRAVAELGLARHGGLGIEVIGNLRDLARFDRPKRAGAARRLGLIGWHKSLKQPHLAVEILARLCESEPGWELRLIGQKPDFSGRLLTPKEKARHARETAYYAVLREAIERAPVRGRVVLEGWTDDVPDRLRDIGFILSCSLYEGTHEAVIEGMASGAIPVVRRWPGAAELYPNSLLFADAAEAAAQMRAAAALAPDARARLRRTVRREARRRFDAPAVLPRLVTAILGPAAPVEPARAMAAEMP